MSQEVTNEELEAYWAEVAYVCRLYGESESSHLTKIIDYWKSELASRGSNPDTL
jgi:hypothetical protein